MKISLIEREKAETAMAVAVKNLLKQKEILVTMQNEIDKNLDDYEKLLEHGNTNAGVLQVFGNFFTWKRQQINLQHMAIRQAEQKKGKALMLLQETEKKVESLQQLREHRFEEYKYTAFAEEQKQIDEIGLQMHMHKL